MPRPSLVGPLLAVSAALLLRPACAVEAAFALPAVGTAKFRRRCSCDGFSAHQQPQTTSAEPASTAAMRTCGLATHRQQNTAEPAPGHASGRRWKGRRKRKRFIPSPSRSVSEEDERALSEQLGYLPPNLCRVSVRSGDLEGDAPKTKESDIMTSKDDFGRPVAVQSYPLLVTQLPNGVVTEGADAYEGCTVTPFPTMFWLTCPDVSRAISELERMGYVRTFQKRLEDDRDLAAKWWEGHERYAAERWDLLSARDRDWLLRRDGSDAENRRREGMTAMVRGSGVAGTDHRGLREKESLAGTAATGAFVPSVKCLHSHYAHYRSQRAKGGANPAADGGEWNVVGAWTHELLRDRFPEVEL